MLEEAAHENATCRRAGVRHRAGSGPGFAFEGGIRVVPTREVPVPDTVSPAMQALIAAPLSPIWNEHPKDAAAWKALIKTRADAVAATLPDLRAKLDVKVVPSKIGGVDVFIVTPGAMPEANHNRLLVHVHGGGYVLFPGESGTREAILMAGYGRMKVISIDYRMPPDHPYPAAMDDAMAVWGLGEDQRSEEHGRSSAPRPAAA